MLAFWIKNKHGEVSNLHAADLMRIDKDSAKQALHSVEKAHVNPKLAVNHNFTAAQQIQLGLNRNVEPKTKPAENQPENEKSKLKKTTAKPKDPANA